MWRSLRNIAHLCTPPGFAHPSLEPRNTMPGMLPPTNGQDPPLSITVSENVLHAFAQPDLPKAFSQLRLHFLR